MKMPTLSIIVPYYNSNNYIKRCIQSILNQTYQDFELILVDDGSTDDSINICKDFATRDKRIILLQKENGGQGTARNFGIENSNGFFIGFVDSDDYIEPEMYNCMLNEITAHEADIAICGYNVFRKNSKKLRPLSYINEPIVYDNYNLVKAYVSTNIISGGPCNKLYKRELFGDIRFPSIRMAEDAFVMPLLLSKAKKGVHVGKCFYNWFLREGSTERSKFTKNNLAALESSKSLQKCVKENYPSLYNYVALDLDFNKVILMKSIIASNAVHKNKDIYNELHKSLGKDIEQIQQFKHILPQQYNLIIFAKQYNQLFIIYEFLTANIRKLVKRFLFSIKFINI
jgi:glycosyltransferase involved in cell wall biosynthesis